MSRPRSFMRRTLALGLCLALAGGASAQGEEVLDRALEILEEGIDEQDEALVQEAIWDLDGAWEGLDDRDRKKAAKAVAEVFEMRSTWAHDPEELRKNPDLEDPRLELLSMYELAVGLLHDKPEGRDPLRKALNASHVKRWPEVQAVFVEGLAYQRDPRNLDLFADYLEHDHTLVAAAAMIGMAELHEAEAEVRREAVETLIDVLVDLERAAEKEGGSERKTEARDRLASLEGSCHDALEDLTGRRLDSGSSWKAWFGAQGREAIR